MIESGLYSLKNNRVSDSVFRFIWVSLLLFMFPGYCLSVRGQDNKPDQNQEIVCTKPDKMPLFNGEDAGEFTSWVLKEIKYPAEAVKQKIIGCVTVSFIIEKDGTLSNAKVVKGVPTLDEEALRVVKSSPKWSPGYKNSIPVRVSFVLPVVFTTTFPSDAKLILKQ